jgi:hypothetical protein
MIRCRLMPSTMRGLACYLQAGAVLHLRKVRRALRHKKELHIRTSTYPRMT